MNNPLVIIPDVSSIALSLFRIRHSLIMYNTIPRSTTYPTENYNQYFSDIVKADTFPIWLTTYITRLLNVIFNKYPTHPRHKFHIFLFFIKNANIKNKTGAITKPTICPKPVIELNSTITIM